MHTIIDQLKVKLLSALRWSEKYTKTDMLYLTRGSFWLSLGQGVTILSGLLLSIAFANLLPPEVFGLYRYIIAASAIIGAFALTGMATAVIQAVACGYDGALRAGFFQSLRWSIGTSVLALGASAYYYLNGNLTLALSFIPIAIATPIILSSSLYQGFLNGKKDFRRASFYHAAHKLVHLVALVSTILLTQNPVIIVAVYFATEACITFTLYTLTQYRYPKNTTTDVETLPYSKHLSVMNGLKLIAAHLDKILIFQSLGPISLAIYAFALAPITQLRGIDKTLAAIALPKLSERSFNELQQTLPRKVLLLSLLMGLLATIYALLAPYIYSFVFPQYLDSVRYSQVFAFSLLFAPHILFVKALVAHKRTSSLYILNSSIPIVQILLLLILLPVTGIWGAIITLFVSSILSTFLSLYLLLRAKDTVTENIIS